MTQEREFEGKDLQEALEAAASALGVPQDELHYDMIEQGRRGLLGMGVKNVRIRVKPPIEMDLGPEDGSEEPAAEGASTPPAPKQAGSHRQGRRRPKRRPDGPPEKKPEKKKKEKPAEPERTLEPEKVEEVRAAVERLISLMGLELEVAAETRGASVELQLDGPDKPMLEERDGELLSAMQFLLNRMSRRAWPDVGRVNLGGDSRSRPRDEEIASMARKVAKQVTKTGKTRKLRPMNAYERRIVHLTIREIPGLSSSSDGNGSLKRIRISKISNQL